MTNAKLRLALTMVCAALVLIAAAFSRGAEYDEGYTLSLTAGQRKPVWPAAPFRAGEVRGFFLPPPMPPATVTQTLSGIAHDLRTDDVHPPLYFWAASLWRDATGSGLFVLRLLSVLLSLGALAALAQLAGDCGIPVVPAVLLTLGCYGFAYTGAIARGFALAQLLALLGVIALLWAARRANAGRAMDAARLAAAGGMVLGMATLANYLAAFIAGAAMLWLVLRTRVWVGIAAGFGFVLCLPADLWFFLAQRESRVGQFPPFALLPDLARLCKYWAATLFGGLPLYAGANGPIIAALIACLIVGLCALLAWHWRRVGTAETRSLLAFGAAAPALGLLALGVAFNNAPFELRYLTFATPFAALLMAGLCNSLPRRTGAALLALLLVVQTASVGGMMIRPETMQPQGQTARAAAAALAGGDGLIFVPRGNDGVGIVAPFVAESADDSRIMVVGKTVDADALRALARVYPRVVLAMLGLDHDSRATLPALRAAFEADPCWRAAGAGFNTLAFDRVCVSPDASRT